MNKITHVAIKFRGKIYSLPPPNRHHNVLWMIVAETGTKYVGDEDDSSQGFLDSEGNYKTRKEALIIAQEAKQLKEGTLGPKLGQLYSEDVW